MIITLKSHQCQGGVDLKAFTYFLRSFWSNFVICFQLKILRLHQTDVLNNSTH